MPIWTCSECGKTMQRGGLSMHKAMHARRRKAAQDIKVETRHSQQHGQLAIALNRIEVAIKEIEGGIYDSADIISILKYGRRSATGKPV